MNKRIIPLPSIFLFLFLFLIALNTLIAKDNQIHVLKWNKVEGASKYLVEIKSENEIVFSTETKENSIKLYLTAGTYLYRVTVFDFFSKSVGVTPWVKMVIDNPGDNSTRTEKSKNRSKAGVTILVEYLPTNISGFSKPFFSGLSFGTAGFSLHWDFGQTLLPHVPILKQLGAEIFFTSSYIKHYDDDNPFKILMTQYGVLLYLKIPFTDYYHVIFGGGGFGSLINASSDLGNSSNSMIFQGGIVSSVDIQFILFKYWVISTNFNILYSPGEENKNNQILQIQFALGTGIWL